MANFFETVVSGKKGEALLAAWIIDGEGSGTKALFRSGEILFRDESFPEEAAKKIRSAPGKTGILETESSRVFLERISGEKKLVICGAGHVALCVIRIGMMLGYGTTVIEDREEYAEKARRAGAQRVICRPFGDALDTIDGDSSTAFVIMTREHIHDLECLRRILQKPCAYTGMMGSRSRT